MIILPRLDGGGPSMMGSVPDPSIFTGELRGAAHSAGISQPSAKAVLATRKSLSRGRELPTIDDADFVDLAGVPRNPSATHVRCARSRRGAGRAKKCPGDSAHEQCIRLKANTYQRSVLPVER